MARLSGLTAFPASVLDPNNARSSFASRARDAARRAERFQTEPLSTRDPERLRGFLPAPGRLFVEGGARLARDATTATPPVPPLAPGIPPAALAPAAGVPANQPENPFLTGEALDQLV